MSKNDGGQAFPSGKLETVDEHGLQCVRVATGGMTLRDYLAAKSISGMLSALDATGLNYSNPSMMAEHAYMFADAMLAAREVAQ